MTQEYFETIVADAAREQGVLLHLYAREHLNTYLGYARAHAPMLHSWKAVWDRVAFAILSANTDTAMAVTALHAMRAERDYPLMRCPGSPGVTPDRLDYVRALPTKRSALTWLRRQRGEPWDLYRCRLRDQNAGLGITKASYAVGLLYPLRADVCCLDIWMQRHLSGDAGRAFEWMSDGTYRQHEMLVRNFARRYDVSTSLGQWIIWDFVRTKFPTSQNFFL